MYIWMGESNLAFLFFDGSTDDLLVSVTHHGDEHVKKEDRNNESEDEEHCLGQHSDSCVSEVNILQIK